ncbi:hypothetical protein [Streptomyces sp. NPDC059564]|uniref:hypothetical protein n=1 Tax=Streptomyces sp. NPDC059564 TaxID=3346865 RepID=UPI0036B30306
MGWQPLKTGNGGETLLGVGLGSRSVAAGEVYEVQFRLRFAGDTPPGDVAIQAGGFEREPSPDETVDSESPEYRTEISSTTDTGTDGNTPKPNGGSMPAEGNRGGTTSGGTGTGGTLAETGTDAATAWALDGGGTVLALGAALVVGTGRHRRKTA